MIIYILLLYRRNYVENAKLVDTEEFTATFPVNAQYCYDTLIKVFPSEKQKGKEEDGEEGEEGEETAGDEKQQQHTPKGRLKHVQPRFLLDVEGDGEGEKEVEEEEEQQSEKRESKDES